MLAHSCLESPGLRTNGLVLVRAACLLVLVGLLAGCTMKFTELSHGLSREEVVDRLGRPSVRRQDDHGRTQWIYFDLPLDEPPLRDAPEGRERLRMRLAERNPAFFDSAVSNYKMTLFLSFDDAGTVEATKTMVRMVGTVIGPSGNRR